MRSVLETFPLGASRLLASVPRGWKGSLSSLALNLAWVLNLK